MKIKTLCLTTLGMQAIHIAGCLLCHCLTLEEVIPEALPPYVVIPLLLHGQCDHVPEVVLGRRPPQVPHLPHVSPPLLQPPRVLVVRLVVLPLQLISRDVHLHPFSHSFNLSSSDFHSDIVDVGTVVRRLH